MDAPTYTPPPPDPAIAEANARAEADKVTAAQQTAGIDSASLMARYGTTLAMGGQATGSPLVAAPSLQDSLVSAMSTFGGLVPPQIKA